MYPQQQLREQRGFDQGDQPHSPMKPQAASKEWPSMSETSPPPQQQQQQQQRVASPMSNPQNERDPSPLKLPLSAQRLQELQRKQAEQEQRLQSLLQQQQQQQQQQQSRQMEERSRPGPDYLGRHGPGPGMPMDDDSRFPHVSHGLPHDSVVNGDSAGGPTATVDVHQNMRNGAPLKPPSLGGGGGVTLPASPDMLDKTFGAGPSTVEAADRQNQLDDMKRAILFGTLKIYVFNKHLELQAKKLALNPHSRRISILRDDGLCEDSWEIDSLRCITQGIDSSILAEAPPPGAASFRFKFQDSDTEDRFLCVVFETQPDCILATEAFGQLCEVPVTAV
mmetsp:Transcript_33906/g.85947  ORF Transcript_33906/g.85947 Transcript_33906/m.85947 type:complete len:336 (+) Transcript_33906:132-1139(+)